MTKRNDTMESINNSINGFMLLNIRIYYSELLYPTSRKEERGNTNQRVFGMIDKNI